MEMVWAFYTEHELNWTYVYYDSHESKYFAKNVFRYRKSHLTVHTGTLEKEWFSKKECCIRNFETREWIVER